MTMQRIREKRAEISARDTLEWIAAARSSFGYWNADDFESFARECVSRAAAALETMRAAESSRR